VIRNASTSRLLALLVLLVACGGALGDGPLTTPPPPFPGAQRVFSASLAKWQIKIAEWLYLGGKGLKRVADYVASTPGTPKVRVYKLKGDPRPGPAELHRFYVDWAETAGFHLLVEVRLGQPPIDPMLDDSNRPYKPKPERKPYAWEQEEYAWVDAFHRPGPDGGVFISVWVNNRHVWIWKPGHCAVAPVVGEWLGLPKVPTDMTPPDVAEVYPPPLDFPPVGDTDYYVRAQAGKWEIDSLCRDLQARATARPRRSPVEALLTVAPATFAPVKHAWLVTFRDVPEKREQSVLPWTEWAERRGWVPMTIPDIGYANLRGWYGAGAEGGAMAVFDVEDTTSVLVFDGPPNLFVLLAVMGSLRGPEAPGDKH